MMEWEMDAHLNERIDYWTPWQDDEDLLEGIMSGALVPPGF